MELRSQSLIMRPWLRRRARHHAVDTCYFRGPCPRSFRPKTTGMHAIWIAAPATARAANGAPHATRNLVPHGALADIIGCGLKTSGVDDW